MALIICPECNKEISDKSKECIHCGYPLQEEINTTSNSEPMQQVEITSVNIKGKNLKKTIISVLILASVIVGGLFIYNTLKTEAEEAKRIAAENIAEVQRIEDKNVYIDNLVLVKTTMLMNAATAERVSGLVRKTWYNAIYEESDSATNKYTKPNGYFVDDFNTALWNYMGSNEYIKDINNIKSDQDTIVSLMKELQNPSDDLENVYETITELHSVYTSVINNAKDPTGNLTSYTTSVNTNIEEFMKLYEKLETQIPEKETF